MVMLSPPFCAKPSTLSLLRYALDVVALLLGLVGRLITPDPVDDEMQDHRRPQIERRQRDLGRQFGGPGLGLGAEEDSGGVGQDDGKAAAVLHTIFLDGPGQPLGLSGRLFSFNN